MFCFLTAFYRLSIRSVAASDDDVIILVAENHEDARKVPGIGDDFWKDIERAIEYDQSYSTNSFSVVSSHGCRRFVSSSFVIPLIYLSNDCLLPTY